MGLNGDKMWAKRAKGVGFESEKEMFVKLKAIDIYQRINKLQKKRGLDPLSIHTIRSRKARCFGPAKTIEKKWSDRVECLGFKSEVEMFESLTNSKLNDSLAVHMTTIGNRRVKLFGPRIIDIIGKKYGYLTIQRYAGHSKNKHRMYVCKCDCGKEVLRNISYLGSKPGINCGCRNHKSPEWKKVLDHYNFENKKDFIEYWLKKGNSFNKLAKDWGITTGNQLARKLGLRHLVRKRGGPNNVEHYNQIWKSRAKALGYHTEKELYNKASPEKVYPEMSKKMLKYEHKKLLLACLKKRYDKWGVKYKKGKD